MMIPKVVLVSSSVVKGNGVDVDSGEMVDSVCDGIEIRYITCKANKKGVLLEK